MANEKRLIDANALMDYINKNHSYSGLPMAAHILTMELLTYAPAVDAVEVVRCKDCKRCYEQRTKKNKQLMRFCMRNEGAEFQVNPNDFCSYGERKEK